MLAQAFPQGLDAHDAEHARRLRMAFDEWDENQLSNAARSGPSSGLDQVRAGARRSASTNVLAEGQAIPQTLKSEVAEYGEMLRPDWIVQRPGHEEAPAARADYPRSQALTKPVAGRPGGRPRPTPA